MSIDVTQFVEGSGAMSFKPLDAGVYEVKCMAVSEISNEWGESFEIDLEINSPRRKMKSWINKPREQMDWNKLDLCFKSFGKSIVDSACEQINGKIQFNPEKVPVLVGLSASVELGVTEKNNNRVAKWLPQNTKPNNAPQSQPTNGNDGDIPF
jgi:hypothetical protein